MCSIAFISGDMAGQGSTLTLFLFKNCRHILATWGLAIMHQFCRPMPLKQRNSFRLQNLVNVTLSIEVALHNNEICFPSAHDATPYHNPPTSKLVPLNETIISKTFPSSSKNSNSTVMMLRLNLDSSENRTRAHCCRPHGNVVPTANGQPDDVL